MNEYDLLRTITTTTILIGKTYSPDIKEHRKPGKLLIISLVRKQIYKVWNMYFIYHFDISNWSWKISLSPMI